MARERTGVPARDLAGVEHDPEDFAVADPDLDALADEVGIQRVVAGIEANVGIATDPEHPAPIGVRHDLRQHAHHLELLSQAVDGPRADRAVLPRIDLHKPHVELVLEVALVGEHAARLEVGLHEPLQPLDGPLACGSRGRQKCQPTLSCSQNAANSSLGRPSWTWMPAWRSQTNVPGSPPSCHRQRRIPASRSNFSLENTNAPAPARE